MIIPKRRLGHIIDINEKSIERAETQIENKDVELEDLPTKLSAIADYACDMGQCYALLGEKQQAREAYAKAAKYNLKFVDAMREHRDVIRWEQWEDAPAGYIQGMLFALIARDDDLLEEIAAEALDLEESYLEEFGTEFERSAVGYYMSKLLAATVLEDDQWRGFAGGLDKAIELTSGPDVREQNILSTDIQLTAFGALNQQETETFVDSLEAFLRARAAQISFDTDDPDELVDNKITGLCLMANDRGISVTIDSPSVPSVLVPDPDSAEYVIEIDAAETEDE